MCGLTRPPSPAAAAARLTIAHACCRARRRRSGRGAAGRRGPARRGAAARARARPASQADRVEGDLADRHEPLAVALADHPHERAVERDVLEVEVERLRDPQAGGVQQLQQRAVEERVLGGAAERPLDLRLG